MKRALKILLPILLIIAIIASIGWYLLKYDPDFTRDMLVAQARRAENNGDLRLSTWLYDLAYRQSGNDEDVAIELAEQYRRSGNHTKAEYTLSHAIADGGSVELYIALCKTYVEQDKLLDAVTMLDNVADPQIKAQLDAQRPAAPTASPEQGYHSQYITVSLDAPEGTVYYTTDGNYPSTQDAPYSQPIALPGGESTVYTLTVGDDGLVSPLRILGYTIAGVIEEVVLTDPAMDQAVRQVLQVGSDHTLYSNELWGITELTVPSDAQSLEDLRWMPFLGSLSIADHDIQSLSGLSSLTDLRELTIRNCAVSSDDLTVIAALPKLERLTLSGCSLSTVAPLSGAVKLTRLDLSENTVSDLLPLSSLTELSYLDLSQNAVRSLDGLGGLLKLTELDASYNSIYTTAPLSGCSALTVLDLTNNVLTSIEGLEAIPGLRSLSLASNRLTDVSKLASATTLTELDISRNAVSDILALNGLDRLTTFDFSYNQITELPPFSQDCALVSITGTQNQLTTLEPLRGLKSLNYVILDQNPGITSVAPLAACPLLVEVNVYGTGVTDVSVLTSNDMNVIVKYSPI